MFGAALGVAPVWAETRIELDPAVVKAKEHQEKKTRIEKDLHFLASDALQGRGVGTSGLDEAAQFIADRWQALGLDTTLYQGTPFQTFRVSGATQLKANAANRMQCQIGENLPETLERDRDYRPLAVGASAPFAGSLVFVGYGITAAGEGWSYDDYAGLDVRGKVVIVLRKEPRQSDPASPLDGVNASQHAFFATKLANAQTHGAAAILFVNDGISAAKSPVEAVGGGELLPGIEDAGKSQASSTIPALFITRQLADRWIAVAQTGSSLAQIEARIDEEFKPHSFAIDQARIEGEVQLERGAVEIKNVVTSIPGAGSLADEAVVIGAHYDHVGMGGPGSLAPGIIEVHNGADDNASGTVALLELSRRFASTRVPAPSTSRRRLILIAFSGEERGLLGSRHYVAYPRFAMESTVAMINMDMVGRMAGRQLLAFGTGTASEFPDMLARANQDPRLVIHPQAEGFGPSDHHVFYERRIPVLHFFTGLHPDYHRPSDDFQKINTDGIVAVTDIVYQLATELLERPERPRHLAIKGNANIQFPIDRRGRLGIRMRWNAEVAKVEITRVEPGSVAEAAGLSAGERILSVDGESLTGTQRLVDKISSKSEGESVELSLEREGETRSVTIRLKP